MLYEKIDHDPKCPLIQEQQEQKAELVTLGTGYVRKEKASTYKLDDRTQLKKAWGNYKKRVGSTDFNVYADGFALAEGSNLLQTWMHLPRCPLCGKETHLQRPSEIIEEHFSRFKDVLPIFSKVMRDLNDYQEYKKVVKKVWNITI